MNRNKLSLSISTMIFLTACGGGGGTKPNIEPPTPGATCSSLIGTAGYMSSSQNGAPVLDNTCPSGQSLTRAGSSFLTTTTSYACNVSGSTTEKPHAVVTTATTVTQTKVCAPIVVTDSCASAGDAPDQYKCRTGFTAAQTEESGRTGDGIVMGMIEPGTPNTAEGLEGKPIEKFSGGMAWDSASDYHGAGVANILLGSPIGGSKGGLLQDIDKLIASPGLSGPIVDNFANQGARIINWSGADPNYYAGQSGVDASSYVSVFNYVMSKNMILIMAAGNQGREQPSFTAAIPYYDANTLNSTLTVVAADPNSLVDGGTAALANYSNHCGLAQDWCLTAPGTVRIPSYTGAGESLFSGTSIAAPIVSAAAALTWNETPWLTAYQLRETMLTTAQDLGAAGVDSFFGWGLVDVAAALHGTRQFRTTWDVNVSPGSYEFSNNISGAGGLTKNGSGSLLLSGNNTFAGPVQVNAGVLGLTGTVRTNVSVANGGTLEGNGGILAGAGTAGNLTNAGTVHVAEGDMQVAGNFVQTDTGMLTVNVDDTLDINGSASLDGQFTLQAPDTYVVDGTIDPVLTAASISGTFDSAKSSSLFFSLSLAYELTDINATLTRLTAASVMSDNGMTSSVDQSAANTLDGLFFAADSMVSAGVETKALPAMIALQSVGSSVQLAAAAHSISGQAYVNQQDLITRAGKSNQKRQQSAFDMGLESGLTTQVSVFSGELDSTNGMDADYQGQTVTVGVANEFDANKLYGYATIGSMDSNYTDFGGRTDMNQYGLGLLYARSFEDSLSLQASVDATRFTGDIDRQVVLPGESYDVTADTSNTLLTTTVGLEKTFALNSNTFALNALLGLQYLNSDAVNEYGQSGLELQMDSDSRTMTYTSVGGDWRKQFATTGGWSISTLVGLDYEYQISGYDPSWDATVSSLNADIQIHGAEYSRNTFWTSLGLNGSKGDNTWFLRFDGMLGNGSEQVWQAGFRTNF